MEEEGGATLYHTVALAKGKSESHRGFPSECPRKGVEATAWMCIQSFAYLSSSFLSLPSLRVRLHATSWHPQQAGVHSRHAEQLAPQPGEKRRVRERERGERKRECHKVKNSSNSISNTTHNIIVMICTILDKFLITRSKTFSLSKPPASVVNLLYNMKYRRQKLMSWLWHNTWSCCSRDLG